MFGAERIDVPREVRRDVHLGIAGFYRRDGVSDRLIGDSRKAPQKSDLVVRLDLAKPREKRFVAAESRARQRLTKACEVARGKVVHLNADSRGFESEAFQLIG